MRDKENNMRLPNKALTFDDVLLVPNHSSVLPKDVSLKTKLTKNPKEIINYLLELTSACLPPQINFPKVTVIRFVENSLNHRKFDQYLESLNLIVHAKH